MNKTKLKIVSPSFYKLRPKLSLQEQALFAKRLSLLLKANASLLEGIRILERQSKSRANRKMFQQIVHDLSNGQQLAKSLGRFKNVFGTFAINIIMVGETSGTLSENLKYLAEEIDKRRRLRQKAVGALIYPLVIMAAALGVSGIMTVYLFPKLLPLFKSLNVELPLTTRALIFISDFLRKDWVFVVLFLILVAVLFLFLMRNKRFHFFINRATLMLPVIGPLLKDYHIANMCRTLGILFKSNVRLLEAVTITADTAPNLVYKKELQNLHRSLAKGGKISEQFSKHPRLFPDMLSQMIGVGESTGNLSETLLYLAQIYDEEFDEQTRRLSAFLEPGLMLVIGLLVGFIAISIITPIYDVTQHLGP